jgi:uncharacterized protein YndB with AHSA1/START domain
MTAVATKPSLTVVRRIKAPPAKVYAAWTDPTLMTQWFGPSNVQVKSAESDLHVGGRFRVVMQEENNGEVHDVSGVYREIEPERKLVFTWAWIPGDGVARGDRGGRGTHPAARAVLRRGGARRPSSRLGRVAG